MATDFAETRSIAWKTTAEMLGLTLTAVATGTPSATTALMGDFSWTSVRLSTSSVYDDPVYWMGL